MKKITIAIAALLCGCNGTPPPPVDAPPPPAVDAQVPTASTVYQAPERQPVVSIYVEPPLRQPPPVRVAWAPPPMLVETPPPMPFDGAIWTGGYWVWEGNWVWAHGRWSRPPRPDYNWVNPYYENRGGSVVFVNGFWAAPGVSFVAPSMSVDIAVGTVAAGVIAGHRPIGPEGVFVPSPPGSHIGLIVPAPIGTAPAVVTSAPPIVREGMRITVNHNNSTTANSVVSNTRNVTNVTNVTSVMIVAPANATANGRAVNASVPAQPHLAAAMSPVGKVPAAEPASAIPTPAHVPGRQPVTSPPAQVVHAEVAPAMAHTRAMEPPPRLAAPGTPAMPVHAASIPAPGAPAHLTTQNQVSRDHPKPNVAQPASGAPIDKVGHQLQPAMKTAPVHLAPPIPLTKPAAVSANIQQNKPGDNPNQKRETEKPNNKTPPMPPQKPAAFPADTQQKKPGDNSQNKHDTKKPKEEGVTRDKP